MREIWRAFIRMLQCLNTRPSDRVTVDTTLGFAMDRDAYRAEMLPKCRDAGEVAEILALDDNSWSYTISEYADGTTLIWVMVPGLAESTTRITPRNLHGMIQTLRCAAYEHGRRDAEEAR